MTYPIHLPQLSQTISINPSDSLLTGLIKAGIEVPHDCEEGYCGDCRARLLSGNVHHAIPPEQQSALSPHEREQNWILMCQASAHSPLSLELPSLANEPEVKTLPPITPKVSAKTFPAKVAMLSTLSPEVTGITLSLPSKPEFNFLAGQFAELTFPKIDAEQKRAYSIASVPQLAVDNRTLSFHIRHNPGGYFAQVLPQLREGDLVRLHGPMGHFHWHSSFAKSAPTRPIILLAGGTGFAPISAMLGDLLARANHSTLPMPHLRDLPIWLYWGVRSAQEIYLPEALKAWAKIFTRLSIRIIPSEDDDLPADEALIQWWGKKQFVHKAILAEWPTLARTEIYASGAPIMIESAYKDFVHQSLQPERFFSDSFTPAPLKKE